MNLRLRELRKAVGMSQTELAEKVGVNIRTIGAWERGETIMNVEQAWDCAAALGCTPNDLCGWYETHPREEGTGLAADEADVLSCYRASTPQWRRNIAMCARAAAGESKNEAERGAPAMGVSVAV